MTTRFHELTWTELESLGGGGTLVLPIGAIEAHGPHLPLDTDVHIAEAMAEAGVAGLRLRGLAAHRLPAFAFTPAPFAAAFPGTLTIRPETLSALLIDLADAVTESGFERLALANAHLDPTHLQALAQVAAERPGLIVWPDLTRRPWALRLGHEFASGACHAGCYETSIVLACRPDLVRRDVQRTLPPNPRSLTDAIRRGDTTFHEAGGPRAYFGNPAAATVDEGEELVRALGEILVEAVVASLESPRA